MEKPYDPDLDPRKEKPKVTPSQVSEMALECIRGFIQDLGPLDCKPLEVKEFSRANCADVLIGDDQLDSVKRMRITISGEKYSVTVGRISQYDPESS